MQPYRITGTMGYVIIAPFGTVRKNVCRISSGVDSSVIILLSVGIKYVLNFLTQDAVEKLVNREY